MSCGDYTLRQRSYTRGRTIVRNVSASTVPFPSVESAITRPRFQTPTKTEQTKVPVAVA
jgi:hypothetical protein